MTNNENINDKSIKYLPIDGDIIRSIIGEFDSNIIPILYRNYSIEHHQQDLQVQNRIFKYISNNRFHKQKPQHITP